MELLRDIAVILLVVNTCLYVFTTSFFKQTTAIKIFTLHLVVLFLVDSCASYFSSLGKNNLFLSHIYFINQFILLSWFYYTLFSRQQKKWVLGIGITVIVSLIIQYSINIDAFWRFNLFEVLVTSLPLVLYSIMHLYNSLMVKGLCLYINASVLIYLSVSTIVFFFGNYINLNDKGLQLNTEIFPFSIWDINIALLIINRVLVFWEWAFTKSVWKSKQVL